VFIPGEEAPNVAKEDEIQEKLATMKVPRIRNPFLMGAGGMVSLVGILLAVVIYIVVMFVIFTPTDIDPVYDLGAWHYRMSDPEQYVFGEITRVVDDKDTPWEGGDHGYYRVKAYEIAGDGVDNRVIAHRDGRVDKEADVWVYSKLDLGDKGDRVLIKVVSKPNELGEERAVATGAASWGSKGYLSGWIFLLPGSLLILIGISLAAVGFIGKADRSMERLFQEDKELRRQQLMLKEAARKQMAEKQKQAQWSDYSAQRIAAMDQAVVADLAAAPLPSEEMIAPLTQPVPAAQPAMQGAAIAAVPPAATSPQTATSPAQTPPTPVVQLPQ
jgi:hypothetical protein